MWIDARDVSEIKVGICVRNRNAGPYSHTMNLGDEEEGWLPALTEGKVIAIEPCGGDQLFLVHVEFICGGHDAWWVYDAGDLYDLEVWVKEG